MIKPLGKNVVLLLEKQEQKTSTGILLPESEMENVNKGKVVAVSEECKKDNLKGISENDIVIYKGYSGTKYKDNDKEYLIIDVEDIIAKF